MAEQYEINDIYLTVHHSSGSKLYRPGDDISALDADLQSIMSQVWTPDVISNYQTQFTTLITDANNAVTANEQRIAAEVISPSEVYVDVATFNSAVSTITTTPGPKGDTGPQGPKGDAGHDGAKGDAGAKGDPGAKGSTGAKGATGAKGDPGAKGATGAKGSTGAKGATGATGPAGVISEYTSGQISLSRGGRTTLSHGLGVKPDNVVVVLEVVTSSWNGYRSGEYIYRGAGWSSDSENSKGYEVSADNTHIYLTQGKDVNQTGVLRRDNGNFARLRSSDFSKFKLRIKAQKFN